ncbi:hypothetical protein M9H77_14757 [Catharanthus roseus]|uniref:Uncharacterized protein n=1 Tax=Catharanthus roseus TaxID=4058 RepID=A0ACC0BP43_CATRO|nr:hypothetical protein M9H77_14757 [Catharanthus roseus]
MAAIRRLMMVNLSQTKYSSSNTIISFPSPSSFVPRRFIASKLFVGGLSFYTTEKGLSETFAQYGQVIEAKIPMDRVSGRSKGFGFVTYASEDEAEKAIKELNGKEFNDVAIKRTCCLCWPC